MAQSHLACPICGHPSAFNFNAPPGYIASASFSQVPRGALALAQELDTTSEPREEGSCELKEATPSLTDNSSLAIYLPKEQLQEYEPLTDLTEGAVRLEEKMISLKDYVSMGNIACQSFDIHPNRKVWVVKTQYPVYVTKRGTMRDATENTVWDAQTGEILASEVKGTLSDDFKLPGGQ